MSTALSGWAQTPDSATHARQIAALRTLDHSLSAVESSSSAYLADLASASPDLVIARSDRLRHSCIAADSAAGTAQLLVHTPSEMSSALPPLRTALAACDRQFRSGQSATQSPDSLRAWAPYRLARLGDALRRYRLVARPLLGAGGGS